MAYFPTFPVLPGLSEIQAKHSYLKIALRSLINRNDSESHRSHPSVCATCRRRQALSWLPLALSTQSRHPQPSNQAVTFPPPSRKTLEQGAALKTKPGGISLPQDPSLEALSLFLLKSNKREFHKGQLRCWGPGRQLPVCHHHALGTEPVSHRV